MSKDPFAFYQIPDRIRQSRKIVQASWLGGIVIRECFDLWSQHDKPWFMLIEVIHKSGADIPDILRVSIDRCEDIEQVLDVHILWHDPSRFFKAGLVRMNTG